MQEIFNYSNSLIQKVNLNFKRYLFGEINWNSRLIEILGSQLSVFLQTPHQLVRNFVAFNAHHTLLSAAVTEEVDAAIPNNFLVDNGKFLMDVRFVNQVDAGNF
jgi:hypothetical protein